MIGGGAGARAGGSYEQSRTISAKLKMLQAPIDNYNNYNSGDHIPPLDVSLHSIGTEVSNMTEITEITTVSQRDKELDKALAQLEHSNSMGYDGLGDGGAGSGGQHPVNALLNNLQTQTDPHAQGRLTSINIDTIPRPSITLKEFVGAHVYWFARGVGLAQDQAESFTRKVADSISASVHGPTTPSQRRRNSMSSQLEQVPEQQHERKNSLAQFIQDRVDTFARNIETLGSVLVKSQHNHQHHPLRASTGMIPTNRNSVAAARRPSEPAPAVQVAPLQREEAMLEMELEPSQSEEEELVMEEQMETMEVAAAGGQVQEEKTQLPQHSWHHQQSRQSTREQ